ncbi:MAG: beta-ketoacyl-ACP synthase II [Proteobacteria bacterium]|nr:beta-ketoacyl-ACP synthase II [Pseudomonadota bacterium]
MIVHTAKTNRVMITGLGCVSPLGLTMPLSWEGLLAKRCGLSLLSHVTTRKLPVSVAGQIHDFDISNYLEPKTANRMERFSQLAYVAAKEALRDADHPIIHDQQPNNNSHMVGVSIGVGMGGVEAMFQASHQYQNRGHRGVSPLLIPRIIPNMATGMVSYLLGLKGPSICSASACSSGTHGIGQAYLLVKHHYAQTMIAGGAESAITSVALSSFGNMKALSKSLCPMNASKPFHQDRNGFVMSEGAGVMVLEAYGHAKKRGARIYGELIGYGSSSDAYHITQPAPGGEGASRCMNEALRDSGIQPKNIDHLNAHGTGTILGDLYEAEAIKQVFGAHTDNLRISGTKGATGHLLGAAGGLEACFATLALYHQVAPPTIPLDRQDPKIDLQVVKDPTPCDMNYAMSLSLGFGGTNAAIVIKKYSHPITVTS